MLNRMGGTGRTPHGVRGLKLDSVLETPEVRESHPSWGAWIEISWPFPVCPRFRRRTPHGVRGLK